MRKLLMIFVWAIGIAVYASDYTPFAADMQPSMTMQSVNTSGYMVSGSMYSPNVYEVGSTSPTSSSPGSPIRKAPPGPGGESDYDPNNPQFAPLTDALIPLFLFALGYLMYTLYRKCQEKKEGL
ncbi:MAG: hypothetical protein UIB40_02590 [Paludibacteraceae bacterium]|nr:hypothetical protein [Paludibacteraceae bacterium]